jgi:hypothetical protein
MMVGCSFSKALFEFSDVVECQGRQSSLAGDARKCGKQRAKGQVEVVGVEFTLIGFDG